jgi:nucleoside-diphosphate-sugar epimerase
MGARVFFTGVSGYLGSVLAAHLAEMPEIDSITGVYHSTTPPIHRLAQNEVHQDGCALTGPGRRRGWARDRC